MKKLFLLVGAVTMVAAGPAIAQPGHAKGHKGPKGHSQGHNVGPVGFGVGGCPPGLAKKGNGCMPPGQAKKLYNVGQRYPLNYGNVWGYNQIPYDLRQRYDFDPRYRYYYGDGYVYRVDPQTMLIREVVSALLR